MSVNCDYPGCIGGYLYTFVGGMSFPTNRKCPKCSGETRKLRAKTHPVFAAPPVQCAMCLELLDISMGWGTPPIGVHTTHVRGVCTKCEVEVDIPVKIVYCRITKDLQPLLTHGSIPE